MADSPFPGMNPFFEQPLYWRAFHHLLSSEIIAQLNAQLLPAYFANLEISTVTETVNLTQKLNIYPDVAIYEQDSEADFPRPSGVAVLEAPVRRQAILTQPVQQRRVLITALGSDELVTIIEVLSPANKRGTELNKYRAKREEILCSDVHLVEIDLIRAGTRVGEELLEQPELEMDYVLLVNRAGSLRVSDIWPIQLNEPLPAIPIPLTFPDPDVILDLGAIVQTIMERYRYNAVFDYSRSIPPPQLRPIMQTWWEKKASSQ